MSMKWEIVKSIFNKVTSKCPQGKMQQICTKIPQTDYALQIHYGVKMGVSNHNPNGVQIPVCATYELATRNHICGHVRFLNFNTEQERYNAWQSYLTKFTRFCVMLDESTKLAPYMDDYTEPWTDERFKQYFGLTDIEWQLIDTVIKD